MQAKNLYANWWLIPPIHYFFFIFFLVLLVPQGQEGLVKNGEEKCLLLSV